MFTSTFRPAQGHGLGAAQLRTNCSRCPGAGPRAVHTGGHRGELARVAASTEGSASSTWSGTCIFPGTSRPFA